MTKGTLRVCWDENTDHVLLYTTHTAMDIPKWVAQAPIFLCKFRFEFMIVDNLCSGLKSRQDVIEHLSHFALTDGLWYPPCVASILISSHPWAFSPHPMGFAEHVPKDTGHDYTLKVSPGYWFLSERDAPKPIGMTPANDMVDWFWAELKKKRAKKKK